ncbi:MAG: hypothetical protein K2X01_07010 [Cyanobacteria bacterium]|nr:hypothetical protein [Cyanobacteriota bacterium]
MPSKSASSAHETDSNSQANAQYQAWLGMMQQMTRDNMQWFQNSLDMAQNLAQGTAQQGYPFNTERTGPQVDPKSMYDAWLKNWTQHLESMMAGAEFSEHSGKTLHAASEAKQNMDQMLRQYWHSLQLANAEDMKEVYLKLYQMERRLDDLTDMLHDWMSLQEKNAPAQKPVTPVKKPTAKKPAAKRPTKKMSERP